MLSHNTVPLTFGVPQGGLSATLPNHPELTDDMAFAHDTQMYCAFTCQKDVAVLQKEYEKLETTFLKFPPG